jgi:hypothetical protein
MRHVMVTPIPKEVDLCQTMRELRFEEVINTVGIFFMDISLNTLSCSEIPREDSPLLVHKFKTPFLPKAPRGQVSHQALVHSKFSQRYPWGDTIGIRQLQELLDTCSSQFLSSPTFLTENDMKHPDSASIFRIFSVEIWLLARDYFQRTPADVYASDLAAAMKMWTIEGLKSRCPRVSLLPTFDNLEVEGKLPRTSFLSRRLHFFPDKNELELHPCGAFLALETSYLSMYHAALRVGDDSHTKINQDLESILNLLQCLPASSKDRGKVVIWKTGSEGCLQFVVNSSLYLAKRITASSSRKNPRPQLSQIMLKKILNPRL